MEEYSYYPQAVCSSKFDFVIDNGIIIKLVVNDGCSGNLQAVCRLLENMPITQAINKLSGIRCGRKTSSCPDQIAQALQQLLEKE